MSGELLRLPIWGKKKIVKGTFSQLIARYQCCQSGVISMLIH